jgi:hypothetical protein
MAELPIDHGALSTEWPWNQEVDWWAAARMRREKI